MTMNSYNFLKLINNIYGKQPIDLPFIEKQGLLAVKIGQAHALRADFLPADKCLELSRLYRQAAPVSAENIKTLIGKYQGADYLHNFRHFEDRPLACASVSQVHRAQLADGREVVVKVVKQDFAPGFKKDLRRAKLIFRVAMLFNPNLKGVANPLVMLDNLEKMTLDELDLRREARGLELLQSLAQQYGNRYNLSKLGFTCVHHELSSANVMVSDYIAGPTLDELIIGSKLKYEHLLDLFRLQGFYMFCLGVFHGDIHPGNIIYSADKYFFVDTGYIGRARSYLRHNLLDFFDHLSEYSYQKAAASLYAMSKKQLSQERYDRFEADFIALYSDFAGKTVSQISLTKKMYQTIRLGVESGLDFSEDIFDVIKSLMYLDGMVLRVNPQAVLLHDMRAFISEFKAKMI